MKTFVYFNLKDSIPKTGNDYLSGHNCPFPFCVMGEVIDKTQSTATDVTRLTVRWTHSIVPYYNAENFNYLKDLNKGIPSDATLEAAKLKAAFLVANSLGFTPKPLDGTIDAITNFNISKDLEVPITTGYARLFLSQTCFVNDEQLDDLFSKARAGLAVHPMLTYFSLLGKYLFAFIYENAKHEKSADALIKDYLYLYSTTLDEVQNVDAHLGKRPA